MRLGRISNDEDERRGVVLEIMSRLREGQFRRLKLFLQARALEKRLSLMPWLKVVTRRVAIDYLRAHPNFVPGSRGAPAGAESRTNGEIRSRCPPPACCPTFARR